jgi:hypothetical protein
MKAKSTKQKSLSRLQKCKRLFLFLRLPSVGSAVCSKKIFFYAQNL